MNLSSDSQESRRASRLVDEAERILRERARQYAEVPTTSPSEVDVLVLEVQGCQVALPTSLLGPVRRAEKLGVVPGTPPFVAGLLNVHGEVVTVLHLGRLIGTADRASPGGGFVALIDLPAARVGVLVDGIVGLRRIGRDRLLPPLPTRPYRQGVRGDPDLSVVDVERLLSDERVAALDERVNQGGRP